MARNVHHSCFNSRTPTEEQTNDNAGSRAGSRRGRVRARPLAVWSGDSKQSRTASATGTSRVEACDLVPKSEMETILGASIPSAKGNFSQETYTTPPS